jgi:hypothetical protein
MMDTKDRLTLAFYKAALSRKSTNSGGFLGRIVTNFWWMVVVIAALSISTWSLYWLGVHVGMPKQLAGVVSAAFDGGAIVASNLCLKWARVHGVSGFMARMAMFSFGGMSAWLNWNHAILANLPYVARFLFAAPPVIALVTIELYLRFEHRAALKRAGNLPKELPRFSKWAWLLMPRRSFGAIKFHVEREINAAMQVNGGQEYTSYSADVMPSHKLVRLWAQSEGREVTPRGPLPKELIDEYMARGVPSIKSGINGVNHNNNHGSEVN